MNCACPAPVRAQLRHMKANPNFKWSWNNLQKWYLLFIIWDHNICIICTYNLPTPLFCIYRTFYFLPHRVRSFLHHIIMCPNMSKTFQFKLFRFVDSDKYFYFKVSSTFTDICVKFYINWFIDVVVTHLLANQEMFFLSGFISEIIQV